ncbi:Hypothetical protein SMAX5B_015812 [Scophthalmus maximus]|uniref:Uncharacterized protein n=1 Tax=Scophthalmus maximus TaxID=52904 RepID=A0A2U9CZ55_SCOMX|nr:Hypothetical protein SMAX5B_015812 [Scophthalmus maximus]
MSSFFCSPQGCGTRTLRDLKRPVHIEAAIVQRYFSPRIAQIGAGPIGCEEGST